MSAASGGNVVEVAATGQAESHPVVERKPALHWRSGRVQRCMDPVLSECPVALCYNGISHAVMMVTPSDLEDFALGFSLSEGIVEHASQIYGIECRQHEHGLEVALDIAAEAQVRLQRRRRQLLGRSGCGLCGIESLDQLAPSAPAPILRPLQVSHQAIQRALAQLPRAQVLQGDTGAAHAAAWCDQQGTLHYLREDVGRHNALDKLLGVHSRDADECEGFVLVTSRASYEMVIKVAAVGLPMLVAVSAPTSLAIDYAGAANLTLVGFARSGRHEIYSGEQRIG